MNETSPDDQPKVDPRIVRELLQTGHRHAVRLILFVALYAASACAVCWMAKSLHGQDGAWVLAAAPLYLIAAASLHGISLFTHEAVHGTLSRNRRWNAVLGAACAIPVLQNFSAYRVLHLSHHEHLGEEGDPDHYPNYTRWSWMVFLMNWGRLLIGYPVYIVAIPVVGFKQSAWRDRRGIILGVICSGFFLIGLLRCREWF